MVIEIEGGIEIRHGFIEWRDRWPTRVPISDVLMFNYLDQVLTIFWKAAPFTLVYI